MVVAAASTGCQREVDSQWLSRTVATATGIHRYTVFVPSGEAPGGRWPILLYLHGADGRGTDGVKQTERELGAVIRRDRARFPLVVVFPQSESLLWSSDDERVAIGALAQTEREFSTDPGRVYVAGYSRGANAAWYLSYRQPTRFAAIVALSGWIEPLEPRAPTRVVPELDREPFESVSERLSGTPSWLFHGSADPVVPVGQSRGLYSALQAHGAQSRYSELRGLGHDIWSAIDVAAAVEWLLSHRRPS